MIGEAFEDADKLFAAVMKSVVLKPNKTDDAPKDNPEDEKDTKEQEEKTDE